MKRKELYETWAPAASPWSPWVKPVLLAALAEGEAPEGPPAPVVGGLDWAPPADGASVIVCDLPGPLSVGVAIALAVGRGYRPVPLFNAVPEPPEDSGKFAPAVDVRWTIGALAASTPLLAALTLLPEAPAVFLLDSLRNPGSRDPEGFDNRSLSFPTDFPSATVLLSRGVRRVILVKPLGAAPQPDLTHTLRRWQDAGLPILTASPEQTEPPSEIVIAKPSFFRLLWYRLLATLGLQRNPLGGFGGYLPDHSAGG